MLRFMIVLPTVLFMITVSRGYADQNQEPKKQVSESNNSARQTSAPTGQTGNATIPEQQKQETQPVGPPTPALSQPTTSPMGPMPPRYNPPPSPPTTMPQNGINSLLPTVEMFDQMRQVETITNLIVQAAEEDRRKESAEKQKASRIFRQRLGAVALVILVFIALIVMNQFLLPRMNQDRRPFQKEEVSHAD